MNKQPDGPSQTLPRGESLKPDSIKSSPSEGVAGASVQAEASDALLDRGVSVPLVTWRLPFRRKPLQWRATMKRPTLGGQMRVSAIYLRMGVTFDEIRRFTKEEEARFQVAHGWDLARMMAWSFSRNRWFRLVPFSLLAWLLLWFVPPDTWRMFSRVMDGLMGTQDFMTTIKSASRANPMKLRLSQRRKGS